MKFKNALIYTEKFKFEPGGFEVKDGKFNKLESLSFYFLIFIMLILLV